MIHFIGLFYHFGTRQWIIIKLALALIRTRRDHQMRAQNERIYGDLIYRYFFFLLHLEIQLKLFYLFKLKC